jgi:hypothetical protein
MDTRSRDTDAEDLICGECGQPVGDGDDVCPHCGADLNDEGDAGYMCTARGGEVEADAIIKARIMGL